MLYLSVKTSALPPVKVAGVTLNQSASSSTNGVADSFSFGALELRPREGLATAGGRALHLSVREFGLLSELALNDGRIVRREELYESVWGEPLRPGDRTVDVYVRRLRVKLAQALPDWAFIHTHVGFGYRFAPARDLAESNNELGEAL